MKRVKLLCGVVAVAGSMWGLPADLAYAQDEDEAIVVTGTRRAERSAADDQTRRGAVGE